MTKEQLLRRKRAVAAAIGSVRAEGLEPSKETIEHLEKYAQGQADIDDIMQLTLEDIKHSPKA